MRFFKDFPRARVVFGLVFLLSVVPTFAQTNGGDVKSITIAAIEGGGLPRGLEHFPDLIHGELVRNFSMFPAIISVFDAVNHDRQAFELMDERYSDDARMSLGIGNLSHTDYLMDGTISRTATGYNLQIRILRRSDQRTVASYSGMSTFMEIENLTGVRRASVELLERMGVTLSRQARAELTGAATRNQASGRVALAQARAAERRGTEVTALNYYFQAAAFDTTIVEAARRSQIMAADISSGRTRSTAIESTRPNFAQARPNIERPRPNIERTQSSNIGENIRNEIQRHRDSVAREEEWRRESVAAAIAWRKDSTAMANAWRRDSTAIANAWIKDSTERDNAWRRDWLARLRETEELFHNIISQAAPPYSLHYGTDIQTDNINYRAETADLSIVTKVTPNAEWFDAMRQSLQQTIQSVMNGLNATGRKHDWGVGDWPERGVSSSNPFNKTWTHDLRTVFELVDENGRVIGRQTTKFSPSFSIGQSIGQNITVATPQNIGREITFNAVKANDISDLLTIRIARINRVPPEDAQIAINVMTKSESDREREIVRRELARALAERERAQAIGREWWGMGVFGLGGSFGLENIDPVYSGGAFIFGGNAEFYRRRSRMIRYGADFDIGFIGVDKGAVKEDFPNVKEASIDEANIMAYLARIGVYVKLQPVNFFYLSGGVGYGSYSRYYGSGVPNVEIKGGNGIAAPILSVGTGLVFNVDDAGGLVLDAQYHMPQDDNINSGYFSIQLRMGIAGNLSNSGRR